MRPLGRALEQRLERIARFFRLPHWPYDPEAEVAWEGRGTWLRLSLVTWMMMAASLAATWLVVEQDWVMIELAVLLVIAFFVSYRLHFRHTSRLLANWLSFASALIVGLPHFRVLWPFDRGAYFTENFDAMGFLVLSFLWITVFRAFALRTVQDLVQTILPCGSILLLVLLVRPIMLTLGCLALVVLATLVLLTYEHRLAARQVFHPLTALARTRPGRPAGQFYSWPTLYALVIITALLVAYGAARLEFSGGVGTYLRIALTRQVMRWFMPRQNTNLPDSSVMLWRLDTWPESDLPVFRARTKIPANWRTGTYHTYTGSWWQRGLLRTTRAVQSGGWWDIPLEGSGASRTAASYVEQEIIPVKSLLGALPTLYCPVSVQVDQQSLRYDRDRVLYLRRYLPPGRAYRVVSYLPPVIAIQRPDTYMPPEMLETDLQLPDTLPQRVRDLAVELTRDAATPIEKVRAIEQHLMYEYEYTLTVTPSRQADFVDHFLFVTKKGFCHHFAGSMVILCRSLGLPSRLVSGFLPGEESLTEPDLYTIRERDAHVWPEVYFAGAGWVPFEPTPPEPEQRRPFAEAWEEFVADLKGFGQSLRGVAPGTYLSGFAALMVVATLLWLWRTEPARRAYRSRSRAPLPRLVRGYRRVRRALAATGAPAGEAIAPRELLAQLPERARPLKQEVADLTEKYLTARFSGRECAEEQARDYEAQVAQFLTDLRRRPERSTEPDS
jgi:transglutaminase-like putative cysteine protease